jgi:hypothetical protein
MTEHEEIAAALQLYFDGLYEGDLEEFGRIFHENSHLYFHADGVVNDWPRQDYFERIARRDSPASQNLARRDRIVFIDVSDDGTAYAKVECQMPPRCFTDYLTLLRDGGQWRIISKTFSAVVRED